MNKLTLAVALLSLIALVSAQCSCQTKPPIDIKYHGEACECGRHYPVQMEVPKITEHRDAHYDYGFTVERPQEPPAEVKYTFDFHMEKPKPLPTASLATYAFEVDTPVQKEETVPQRYSFDYQIQKPVSQSGPAPLQGLLAHVDKVIIQRQDCQEKSGCQCSSYKPTIDLLQRCPRHGHLYRNGGPLYPNQQRYNKDSDYVVSQIADQVPITSSIRSKRDVVATPFPVKIRVLLPGIHSNRDSNNQISKVEHEAEENRISEIMKQNFGEDPMENIDELLRPKPLGSQRNVNDAVEETPSPVPAKSDFISKIKPKIEEAKSNLRSQITKFVNKVRLDTIKANHLIQKRSTESDVSDETFDVSYEPVGDDDHASTNDRFRKNCERCAQLAKKFPCPSCAAAIPSDEQRVRYTPQQFEVQVNQPRYVAERFADTNGNDEFTVGSYHNQPAYSELEHILSKNSGSIYSQNRGVGEGHILQPMNFEHASEAIRFIQELTQRNGNPLNEGYRNGNPYDVGSGPQNFHAKRSFKIVPLAEKEDGSVFVKISPVGVAKSKSVSKSKLNEKPKSSPVENTKYEDDETMLTSNVDEQKPKANFEKFVRNGKKYEILALNGDDSDEGSVGSEEDLEILKYIYAVNQKGLAKEVDDSDGMIDDNDLTNITHMET